MNESEEIDVLEMMDMMELIRNRESLPHGVTYLNYRLRLYKYHKDDLNVSMWKFWKAVILGKDPK